MAKETRFERLVREGAGMTLAAREECVRGLMLDDRFAGLLGFIVGEREEYIEASCDQALAGSPGKQSHAWGSVHALRTLLDRMREVEKRGARVKKTEEVDPQFG